MCLTSEVEGFFVKEVPAATKEWKSQKSLVPYLKKSLVHYLKMWLLQYLKKMLVQCLKMSLVQCLKKMMAGEKGHHDE
jgi:hypothetical protein